MGEGMRRVQLGAATVTVINVGDLRFSLADEMALPESVWRPGGYSDVFAGPLPFPSQCMHVAAPGVSLMVDASVFDVTTAAEMVDPGYVPPPGMRDQLAAAGVRPEDVRHVVITHAHWDHFNGTTLERDGRVEPAFPNARYHLGRADWEHPDTQEALADAGSLEYRTLRVLREQGLLELVEGDRDLGGGVRIVAAPGESPGHQIVRVESQGQVLYCLGDLYHHTVEVERPDWMATWADRETILASRHALAEAALAENALLVAAHIYGVGRLEPIAAGVRWVDRQQ
jgi:glyoxylase-like metal-dependent hydrolase (beta-lactamase superfamily II)